MKFTLFFVFLLMLPAVFAQNSFIEDFFIKPLVEGTGYNIVNTLTFALILIAAAFSVYKILKKIGIKIDKNFIIGVSPFIAMGGILRAWEDLAEASGIKRNFLLVSPFIYISIFLIAFILLIVTFYLSKKIRFSYYKIWFVSGALIDIYFLSQLRFSDSFAFVMVIIITLFWIVLFALTKFISKSSFPRLNSFLTGENLFIILAHLFDAATTFVALQYLGYFEQHVLPSFVIGMFGAWTMFLLKLIVVPIVLYAFDKELKEELEKKTFLKMVVLILGLAPGLRNWLRMIGGF